MSLEMNEKILLESSPKDIYQWMCIYEEDGETKELYQYEGEKQNNIRKVIELENTGKLKAMYLMPLNTSEESKTVIGVNLKTGIFTINGTQYSNFPDNVEITDFRFVFYRTIHTSFGSEIDSGSVKYYKIGWQSTVNDKNYQRVIWFNPSENSFILKEKR